jgi:hypothetical protein
MQDGRVSTFHSYIILYIKLTPKTSQSMGECDTVPIDTNKLKISF